MENENECRALVVYRPPSHFTALEDAIFFHGTHEQRREVLWNVCMRGLGIPLRVLGDGETNYSRMRKDYEEIGLHGKTKSENQRSNDGSGGGS
jgi:hypothetical protein